MRICGFLLVFHARIVFAPEVKFWFGIVFSVEMCVVATSYRSYFMVSFTDNSLKYSDDYKLNKT